MPTPLEKSAQVFLLERDTGILCRILGLYTARGIHVERAEYAHAAPRVMVLTVTTTADAELLRVLVSKAATLVGVIEAAERSQMGEALVA